MKPSLDLSAHLFAALRVFPVDHALHHIAESLVLNGHIVGYRDYLYALSAEGCFEVMGVVLISGKARPGPKENSSRRGRSCKGETDHSVKGITVDGTIARLGFVLEDVVKREVKGVGVGILDDLLALPDDGSLLSLLVS